MVSSMGDGSGGATKPSKMPIEMTVRSTGMNTASTDLGEKEEADRVQVSNMETIETEAQFMLESHNNSTLLNEVIASNSKLSTCHINSVDFDAQIQEIDVALGKYDSCENNVAPNLTTTSHASATSEATLTPS